jgi:hypothetical protein
MGLFVITYVTNLPYFVDLWCVTILRVQIISKGKIKSAEHRAVTNSNQTRTSAAFFIAPSDDCLIEPAHDLTHENNQPILRSFKYKEFLKNFFDTHHGDTDLWLKSSEAPKN